MSRPMLAFSLTTALMLPAMAALESGDLAPAFEAQAALAGKTFTYSLQHSLRNGPVVVYFYPSAYTSGCNIQAHTFSTMMDDFTAAGASVIGVSLDDIDRLTDFSADPEYCAGKLAVAADPAGTVARAYDLEVAEAQAGFKDTRGAEITHGFAERTTFVVTPDGRVAATIGGVSPVENVQQALAAVQKLQASD